jgi:hypothetical protein
MILRCLKPFVITLFLLSGLCIPAALFGEGAPDSTGEETAQRMDESSARSIIDTVYLEVLQRYPDEGGLHTYLQFLVEEGKSEQWLRQVLLNSEEGRQVSRKKQQRTYVLLALAALPLIFLGFVFYYSRSVKDFMLNSLLLFVSLGTALLLLEVTLRMAALYMDRKNAQSWENLDSSPAPEKNAAVFLRDIIQLSANPRLVYELKPNLSVRFMGGVVQTDMQGFRITPGSCAQPEAYTIAGLGDSVMFGWGVHDQETYLAYLGQALTDHCIRIVNMAVPGYNTVMEVATLEEKGLAHRPDLVVMHFVENDLYLPNFIRKKDKHITLTRSYLLAALSRWRGTRVRTRPFDHLVRNSGEVPEEYHYMVGVDAYRRAMIRFKELSREHDFKILLLTNWAAPDYVAAIASELQIPVVELEEPLERYSREHGIAEYQGSVLTVSKNDPHYSALAHRIVAEEVLRNLPHDAGLPDNRTVPAQQADQDLGSAPGPGHQTGPRLQ